jgi:hypothetical protein
MSEQTKPEATPQEMTKEQLEGVSGGAIDAFMALEVPTQPTKPVVIDNPTYLRRSAG